MKKVLLGFVLGVGFVSFLLFGFSHQASYCTQGGNQSSQEQPTDSHADAASKSSKDGHAEPGGHAKKPARFGCGIEGVGPAFVHMMDSHEGFFMGSFTFLLVMVTAWLVYTTSGLRESTDRLWEAGEKQIAVARTAANAAEKSAHVAEQALRMSERPMIGIGPWEIDIKPGFAAHIMFKVRNVGRSTAFIFDHPITVSYSNVLPPPIVFVPTPTSALLYAGGHIHSDVGGKQIISPGRYDLLVRREQFIFVCGRISYRDDFDDIYDLGFVIRIEAITDTEGVVKFVDAAPNDGESYTYLTKRPPQQQA
jgi:hypothetical protein